MGTKPQKKTPTLIQYSSTQQKMEAQKAQNQYEQPLVVLTDNEGNIIHKPKTKIKSKKQVR